MSLRMTVFFRDGEAAEVLLSTQGAVPCMDDVARGVGGVLPLIMRPYHTISLGIVEGLSVGGSAPVWHVDGLWLTPAGLFHDRIEREGRARA